MAYVLSDILADCMVSDLDEVRQSQMESCLVTLSTLLTLGKSHREIFYQYDGKSYGTIYVCMLIR